MEKLFRVIDPKTQSDVLGGAVTRGNAHLLNITAYAPGRKPIDELDADETTKAEFKSCGSKGIYLVHRVQ